MIKQALAVLTGLALGFVILGLDRLAGFTFNSRGIQTFKREQDR